MSEVDKQEGPYAIPMNFENYYAFYFNPNSLEEWELNFKENTKQAKNAHEFVFEVGGVKYETTLREIVELLKTKR
jgi:hypothetical protein